MQTGSESLRVVGIAGSLRRDSFNRRLLAAARDLAPPEMRIDPLDIADVPLYNADIDADDRRPGSVERLKRAVAEADGLLIASPEYNHTVPGVMQNTIDWLSRPSMKSPLAGKPVAIMGASRGAMGTARGQQHLKLTLLSTMAVVMPHPGVLVGSAADKFDATSGALTHEATQRFLADFLSAFAEWIERVGAAAARR